MSDVMTELIDVLDENGNKTGEVETKEEIYKRGLWHRSVHIWIENDKQELLVQKRNPLKNTFPNLWAISSAGHVIAGETSIESGLRELKEELDVDAKKEDLEFLFTIKRVQPYKDSYIRVFDDVYDVLRRRPDPELPEHQAARALQQALGADPAWMPVDIQRHHHENGHGGRAGIAQ